MTADFDAVFFKEHMPRGAHLGEVDWCPMWHDAILRPSDQGTQGMLARAKLAEIKNPLPSSRGKGR